MPPSITHLVTHSIQQNKKMAELSKLDFEGKFNNSTTGLFKNNTNRDIGADDVRTLTEDITDSFFNKTDDAYTATKGNRAGITAPASLKDIVTVGMPFGVQIQFTDSTASNVVRIYELTNETTAQSSPTVIRPNDYAGTTNEKVWRLRATIDVDSDAPGGAVDSVNGQTGAVVIDVTTREFNRAWTASLLFDYNVIRYLPQELSGDVEYTIAAAGHLVNQESTIIQEIITDGTHAITFTGFNYINEGFVNGSIPTAGTYSIFVLYINGTSWVNFFQPSSEEANLTQLSAPANFDATDDGETEIDLTWDDVGNESSYRLERSLDGTTGWSQIGGTIAAGTTSYSDTGLSEGTTYFYRLKAVGDGLNYSDSIYSEASAMTQEAGDVTPPTFTFLPANGNNTWSVNAPITITASEALRNTDGSALDNSNIAAVLTLKETNSGGANIAFSATIDVSKTIITITPTTLYGATQLVYVAINNVEDVNGNEVTVAESITFTTTDYTTFFNGSSNRIVFGDILDTLFTAADTNFWLEATIKNHSLTGAHRLWIKTGGGTNNSWVFYYSGTDVYFFFYFNASNNVRVIKWTGVLGASESVLVLKYDGSVDTNDGLDRATLLINTVVQGSKTLEAAAGSLSSSLMNSTAQLAFGVAVNSAGTPIESVYFTGEAKDLIIRSASGATVEINLPVVRDGQDTSGNNRDGTWV
jgi:hypothetical protein